MPGRRAEPLPPATCLTPSRMTTGRRSCAVERADRGGLASRVDLVGRRRPVTIFRFGYATTLPLCPWPGCGGGPCGCARTLGFLVERVTGIEAALSAWEVCGATRVLPAESVTCGDLDGLSASDRDYLWALLPSGTQRARVHPRMKSRAKGMPERSEVVREFGWSAARCSR